MGSASTFDYVSLKELLKDTKAEVLLPSDGAKYEKSIERWGEQCIKRAVSITSSNLLYSGFPHHYQPSELL
jgi:hypothetical protein